MALTMTHGAHTSLYNPMTHGAHASLYNPMTHGDLYPLYNIVWPHHPWGFVTIAAPMTHGKKVAEPCDYNPIFFAMTNHNLNKNLFIIISDVIYNRKRSL